MTSRRLQWLIRCAPLALLIAGAAVAQTERALTPAELMGALKVGQWVKLEGAMANAPVVQCSQARVLTEDMPDGNSQITANVRSVDLGKGTFVVYKTPCKVVQGCTFKSKTQPSFIGLAQVKPGMFLNVEGTFMGDGTLLARRVTDKSDEVAQKPERKALVRLRGRVAQLNSGAKTMTVLGVTFQVGANTQAKSVTP